MGVFGDRAIVQGARFQNIAGVGIQTGGGIGIRIINNYITTCSFAGIYAHPDVGSGDVNIVDMLIDGNTIDMRSEPSGGTAAISVAPVGVAAIGVRITNNWTFMIDTNSDGSAGIVTYINTGSPDPDTQAYNFVIADNVCIGGGFGLSDQCSNSVIANNVFNGCGYCAIEVGGNYNVYSGNKIYGLQFGTSTPSYLLDGIIVGDGAAGHAVTGNVVQWCTLHGILLSANTCTIGSNVVIMIESAGVCLHVTDGANSSITGNVFSVSGGAIAYDEDTPGSGIKLRGNVGVADAG
jgi:hypothetical protein